MPSLKRILVTGGAGFLGSHLCERLVGQRHNVICLDNFFTSQKSNVSHLLGKPNFELVRHDITLPIHLEVDEIYNLACPAAPGHYQFNPIKTMKTSVLGAIHVLGMAKRCRAEVLQASTSEVYGNPQVHPQPESYRGAVNPVGPRACYDEGKRAAETLFTDYHRANRVNVRIARIFNTYGPRMHPFDGRVVSNFICQALRGEDLTLFGDGSQTRSFCYRDNLVDGLIRLMDGPDNLSTPMNLGNPEEFTIAQLPPRSSLELTGAHEAGLRAAAGGRSDAASAGHHAGHHASRLAADGAVARGLGADDRLVSLDRHGTCRAPHRIISRARDRGPRARGKQGPGTRARDQGTRRRRGKGHTSPSPSGRGWGEGNLLPGSAPNVPAGAVPPTTPVYAKLLDDPVGFV